jgi:cell division transport system permease protein
MVINVLKLVGATDAYVRRPFLYSGALHGLLAGLFALGLVALVVVALSQPVERLAQTYSSSFKLAGLPAEHAAILVAAATLLGWFGALIGLGFKLRHMEPRA